MAVGVEPSKLPNLQRILLNEALKKVAWMTGKPAPVLPEIAKPVVIARNQ